MTLRKVPDLLQIGDRWGPLGPTRFLFLGPMLFAAGGCQICLFFCLIAGGVRAPPDPNFWVFRPLAMRFCLNAPPPPPYGGPVELSSARCRTWFMLVVLAFKRAKYSSL